MKLASEKPPEAVLEGVIFTVSYRSMPPDLPRLWCASSLIPLWHFSWTGFFLASYCPELVQSGNLSCNFFLYKAKIKSL